MSHSSEIAALARLMRSAQDSATQLDPFTARPGGLDLAAAYTVADAVHQSRVRDGAKPLGRKIGFTNSAMWDVYGVRQPVWGWMLDSTVSFAKAQRARCSLRRFAEPKIEPEIVLHFGKAPPVGPGSEADLAAILDCVDWVAHGFEIVQSHFPGWKFQVADTVADGGLHGCLLIGEPVAIERLGSDPLAALRDFSITLACDGAQRDVGRGSNVLGSPLAAIAHLIAVLGQHPEAIPLQAGEIITTGTLTAAWPVTAGQTWSTVLNGIALPGLVVDFVA